MRKKLWKVEKNVGKVKANGENLKKKIEKKNENWRNLRKGEKHWKILYNWIFSLNQWEKNNEKMKKKMLENPIKLWKVHP